MKFSKRNISRKVGIYRFKFVFGKKLSNSFLHITSSGGVWSMQIAGNTDTFGYLYAAALKEYDEQLLGYATILAFASLGMTSSQDFSNNLGKAVNDEMDRRLHAAKKAAKATTDAQEQTDMYFMLDAIERGEMTAKASNKARQENKQILKEIIDEQS